MAATKGSAGAITGQITTLQGVPLPGITIRAYLRAPDAVDTPIGITDVTDVDGRYEIDYTLTPATSGPITDKPPESTRFVFIRAYEKDAALGESGPKQLVQPQLVIDLSLNYAAPAPGEPWLRVYGTVRNQYGDPMDKGIVEAFDRDMRSEQLLGDDKVTNGRYEIRYRRSQFVRAEKDAADLVMKVLGADEQVIYQTPVRYNVPDELELDIDLRGVPYPGPSEWERVTSALLPLLDGVPPTQLREDDQFQDVSFLSGETGLDRRTIYIWIACQSLADKTTREETPLAAEVFFAFLRQGQPSVFSDTLLQDMQFPERRALLDDKLVRNTSALSTERRETLLRDAIAANLVPARIEPDIPAILATLQRIRLRYAASDTFGGGKGTSGEILKLTAIAPEKQDAFLAAFTNYSGPRDSFWADLEKQKILLPEEVKQVRRSLEVGALTLSHVPLVGALLDRFRKGALTAERELATYDNTAWIALFKMPGPDGQPIGVPSNIDGATPEERMNQFAAILEEQLERAYPTTAFAAKLARRGDAIVPAARKIAGVSAAATATADVSRFFANNPEFELDRYRIDHYVAEHGGALDGVKDPQGTIATLKTMQRVFKLNPTFDAASTLLSLNIDSAQQIYFMGSGQFLRATENTPINRIEAKQMYNKAENAYALALTMFADYNIALNGVAPAAVPPHPSAPEAPTSRGISLSAGVTTGTTTVLPNLQALFGSLDYCECTDCRSVYSPAAYFVDVMRFLGDRSTQGTGVNAGKSVRQVLLERRPDLGDIELSCENTNTPLPYIDLVNELLEDVVAPPTPVVLSGTIQADLVEGTIRQTVLAELTSKSVAIAADAYVYAPDIRGQWVVRDSAHAYRIAKSGTVFNLWQTRQSSLSAAELRANPEYTKDNAYQVLRQAVFPLALPFDLPALQARAYLEHLGVPYPRLLELFQQKAPDDTTLVPSDLQIDAAWLGISDTERQILTGTLAAKQSWDYWGLAETGNNIPNPSTPSDPTTNIVGTWIQVLGNVDVMLHRSRLTYRELLQLLDTRYVNATGSIYIFDTPDPNAANCDTSRFTIGHLTRDSLDRAQRFIRLWRKLGIPMWELDLLLPDVNADPSIVDKRINDQALQDISRMQRVRSQTGLEWRVIYSLYGGIDHEIYHDWSLEGAPAVQTLYERLFRNKLVDAVASFPARPTDLTGTVADRVPGILAAFQIKEADLTLILATLGLPVTTALTAQLLGRIHRITALASALDFTVDAFLRLARLSGQDPFANPAATLRFVMLAESVVASPFSVLELDYLLAHQFTASSGVALEDRVIVAIADAIRNGLQQIADDVSLKSEETNEAYVKSRLGLLPTLRADADQATALGIIDGTWQGSDADRNTLIATLFADVLDASVATVKLGPIAGLVDSSGEISSLPPAARQAEVDGRFAYVQPELQALLLGTQSEDLIRQKMAEMLGIDVPSTAALLDALHLSGDASTLLERINDPRLLARLPDGTYQFPSNEANLPALFQSVRLLHKVALVVRKLVIRVSDLLWWLAGTNASRMGWMHPGDFPISTGASLPIDRWVALQQFFDWKSDLPKSDITPFEFATRILDSTTSSSNLADLAALTGWFRGDLDTLVAAFHWLGAPASHDVVKQELRKSANLVRLADAMRALRRLGVNAARAVQWANAQPSAADAESLKQTVKAKYDLTRWQEVIRPLQDEFRERKRQALVMWLVAHPDQARGQQWVDADGLYSYFLIDVEMSACMLTSRIKQAAASAQLFVQRCLLDLERDILANTDLDPKWKQWKWMKRYRVWEANRKVFLYPENWLEPELRDEKSPFFKELENELQQNEVTNDTAEQAYRNYLEKLDKVANLEIRTIFEETIAPESALHVIGRTRSSQSPEYFYRKRINRGRWTPWESTGLDINSNHLMAGIHNRRLYLLWPQFLAKAQEPYSIQVPPANSVMSVPSPLNYWEIRLFWSELKKEKWTPKVLSSASAPLYFWQSGGLESNVEFRIRLAPQIQTCVYRTSNAAQLAPWGLVHFEKLGQQMTAISPSVLEYIISPPQSQYSNNLILHTTSNHYFYYGVQEWGEGVGAHENALSILVLKNITPSVTYSVIDSQASALDAEGSFCLWDDRHTYLVDYIYQFIQVYYDGSWNWDLVRSFQFFIHYHPFVELFSKELNVWGIKGLLNRRIQVDPTSVPDCPPAFDFASYQPESIVPVPLPVEDVDFSYTGAYSPYNWELFFHAPFFIANKLSANQRFEEALEWFHYIFDPTSTDTTTPNPDTPQQKFWITKPFYETTRAEYYQQKIESIMVAIAKGDVQLREQVSEWRDNPFNPHLIARMRTVAYQKNVLIKYLQTLVAWGDQLFRQDTIESINEATQLYILAASILGPRPKSVPRQVSNPVRTYFQLQAGTDAFGNVLREVENLLPPASSAGTSNAGTPELPKLDVLYFCIPNNENLLTLWDTVSDRLFKIRHCMNLEGVARQLPLFEPSIDPGALVKAAAAGVDIGTVLSDMSAPLPLYRFTFTIQRANELCNEVKVLGSAMLAALERRDAEALSLLRSGHEKEMLELVRLIKLNQIDEALRTKESFEEAKKVVEERQTYYARLIREGLNPSEITSLLLGGGAIAAEVVATVLNALGAGTSMIPEVTWGVAGFGGSPLVTLTEGGQSITSATSMAANISRGTASILQIGAGMAATIGGHMRRADEWTFQQSLADKELEQVKKQIAAAELRHAIATQELTNHDKLAEQRDKEEEFLFSKFTSQELYDWMIGEIATIYFQSYQLAYDVAKRAERCFRYELGLSDSSYIQFGGWDSLKKGLLAGDRLSYDLKRLETAYYEQNRREYELKKHVSLAQLDPIALLRLRQNGECFVDIPETAFDMDYPGHYFRRLKSVSLSIPCTVGPYTTVGCTLTLTSNHLRKDSTLLAGKYTRDVTIDDPRFRDEIAGIQSIATSDGRNDSGVFELSFRDERYLPFEGAGAISSWQIKLNKDLPQFDFSTIADVVLHLEYTAREGGELLRSKVVEEFNQKLNDMALAENRQGLFRVFDLKREYPDQWYRFLHPANPADDQAFVLDDLAGRLPYFTRQFGTKKARRIEVVAHTKDGGRYKVMLSPLGSAPADQLSLAPDTTYQGMHRAVRDLSGSEVPFGSWTLKLRADAATDFKSLPADAVDELFLVANYTVA